MPYPIFYNLTNWSIILIKLSPRCFSFVLNICICKRMITIFYPGATRHIKISCKMYNYRSFCSFRSFILRIKKGWLSPTNQIFIIKSIEQCVCIILGMKLGNFSSAAIIHKCLFKKENIPSFF